MKLNMYISSIALAIKIIQSCKIDIIYERRKWTNKICYNLMGCIPKQTSYYENIE